MPVPVKSKPNKPAGAVFLDNRQLNQIWRLLGNVNSPDGSIEVKYSKSSGLCLTAKPAGLTPFAGSYINAVEAKKNITRVFIGADRDEEEYPFRDTITLGTQTEFKGETESIVISKTGYVYYKIEGKHDSPFTAVLNFSEKYPDQDDLYITVVLGKIIYDDEEKQGTNWHQYQIGNIDIHSRFA